MRQARKLFARGLLLLYSGAALGAGIAFGGMMVAKQLLGVDLVMIRCAPGDENPASSDVRAQVNLGSQSRDLRARILPF